MARNEETQDRQCQTGREISGYSWVYFGPENLRVGLGRKSTTSIALVALASLAPLGLGLVRFSQVQVRLPRFWVPDPSLVALHSHTAEKEEACFKYSSVFQTAVPILRFFFQSNNQKQMPLELEFLTIEKIVLQNMKLPFFNFDFSSSKPNSLKKLTQFL